MTTVQENAAQAAAPGRARRQQLSFHPLRVSDVERLTDEAVAISFEVPEDLRALYEFTPGQHLTLRRTIDGEETRRSYSICAPAGTGRLRVAVKRIDGGVFSEWATSELRAGDEIDVMTPAGRFGISFEPGRARHYTAIAAGSGITPVISLVETALAVEGGSRFTLVYGNRTSASVMFLEELADLKNRYPERLQVVHVLSREAQDAPLLSGRIDAEKLALLLTSVLEPDDVEEWFLCGPAEMVQECRRALLESGVDTSDVHHELFHVAGAGPAPRRRSSSGDSGPRSSVTVLLDGRSTAIELGAEDEPVLDAVLRVRADAPFACKGGVCGTCRAKVVEGSVRMDHDYALEEAEKAAGYVLTCQAHPTSERVLVDFDA
ncbi:1,2-phenylacetyl-CoA epoxidase subunit PaaE [Kineococcus auxinigenes]|uniref:1,2-phenylacetyl-CoA epoxidase subunit PaaE n=1 Tax=unclassified Kineococcus TaxID=2621656 RepID=UPI003D7F162E